MTKPQIIGGAFGLAEVQIQEDYSPPFFIDKKNILLANARSGIALLVKILSPRQVWLPSYLCDVMLEAVLGTPVGFYEVNYDLTISSLEWINDIQPGDLVILIDYFGFPIDSFVATQIKEQGAYILEDASQALFSENLCKVSDFLIFSPRKFLGVPDGGILIINCEINLVGITLDSTPSDWWLRAFHTALLRREFDAHGGSREWVKMFQEVDAQGPIGSYSMSQLTEMLLTYCFDYLTIKQKRIENYQILSKHLSSLAIFPELKSGVVPLGFPIRLQYRDQVRRVLFDHEIYPPIHWQIDKVVPQKFTDSHRLAFETMTLVCDQRYNADDMLRTSQLILDEVTKIRRYKPKPVQGSGKII